MNNIKSIAAAALLAVSGLTVSAQTMLNISYDVAREFYKEYNSAFVANYKKTTGKDLKIDQAHGGSSAQARAVNDGLDADVVNPKTGGNGRKAYLAAWGYVRKKGGSEADAAAFVAKLYKNVPVLAKGGRDATTIFLQRNIGDVLVTFESEVISVDNEFGTGKVDAIHPSISIVAENPVAVVHCERSVWLFR